MKKSAFYSLVYGNRIDVICAFFTAGTMLDLILCVSQGILDISYWHLGMRLILCTFFSLSLMVFRHFERLSILMILLIHFFICILIMLLFVWVTSLYSEIHPNAYRDAVRTVFYFYPFIIVGGLIIDGVKTAKANRILRKNSLT